MSTPVLHVEHITMQFGGVVAVNDLSMDIYPGEIVALIGPNGAGKTTAFNCITGVYEPTNGRVDFMGEPIVCNHPRGKMKKSYAGAESERYLSLPTVSYTPDKITKRGIARTFQNIRLFKSMTVFENVLTAMHVRRTSNVFSATFRANHKEEAAQREKALELLKIVGLDDVKDELATALPYGKQRRLEIARALATSPKLLLLDEPLSNLDAKMRVQMRTEISKLHQHLESTMIYVTHDQVEAMTMGDRICVMKDGVIQQVAAPIELYDNPCNKFVAGFIGTPPMNFFDGVLVHKEGKLTFVEPGFHFEIPPAWKEKLEPFVDKKMTFGVRPEDIGAEQAEEDPNMPRVHAKVEVLEPMGSETFVYLNTGENSFIARIDPHKHVFVGQEVDLAVLLPKAHMFDGETEKAIV